MTQFQTLVKYMAVAYRLGHSFGERAVMGKEKKEAPPHIVRIFEAYTPNYWTAVGLRSARLDRVEMYRGRPQAYYSMVFFNPIRGKRERSAWRYTLKNGVPVEEKAFPVSYR